MSDLLYPSVLTVGTGPIKVAAVGDSLTYGYGLDDRSQEAYPSILSGLLGERYQVSNFGLSGRSLQSTSDYPYFREENARLSLESEADVVLIMLGTNDSRSPYWDRERFESEYRQMVATYLSMPSQPDILLLVPPFIPTSRFGLDNAVIRDVFQELIPRIARDYQVDCINLYPLTEGQTAYYSDGLHLTAKGNQAIAQTIYQRFFQ